MKEKITLSIPKELMKELKEYADKERSSISRIVGIAIERYIQ